MLLSDIISRLGDEAFVAETVLDVGNVGLLAEMQMRAAAAGVTLGEYASWAVRSYADAASPDEWVTLIGSVSRAHDPGADCLRRVFDWVISNEEAVVA
jgi:hypothetical protein